ncbi:MAG: hypothetical protein EPO16_11505 [Dehalococcoidia bacterium]|nr:MAG: hypothetical protein EPO16_11505 [Dehalococcoidia bacterium]
MARRSRAASPAHPAIGFCRGTPLSAEIERRDPALLQPAIERATAAVAERFGLTSIDGKIQAHILTCIR